MKTITKLILCIAVAGVFSGCKTTQYVPVEVIKTEYKNHTDTITKTDTVFNEKETVIREADSTLIKQLGLQVRDNERIILVLRKELQKQISKEQQHTSDTVIKTDSVQVPYPVPAQLSIWQSFCCEYGKFMLGGSVFAILMLVFFIFKRLKP